MTTEPPKESPKEPRVLTAADWKESWKAGKTAFHLPEPHPFLVKHFDEITGGKADLRVFVPFCGKSVDMKHLLDHGHRVVGIDGSEVAIQQFQEEQGIDLTKEPIDGINGNLFRTSDDKLKIYCCDLYDYKREPGDVFDIIWDRGGLIAVNQSDRKKFVDVMMSLMAPECRHYLVQMLFDQSLISAPPYCTPTELLQELYGLRCNIEIVDEIDALQDIHVKWGLQTLTEQLSVLTQKK